MTFFLDTARFFSGAPRLLFFISNPRPDVERPRLCSAAPARARNKAKKNVNFVHSCTAPGGNRGDRDRPGIIMAGVTTPFWLDEPYSPRAPLSGAVSADIAVLGGGLTGVSAAHFLAARGCRVALVERDVLASGASGRNAGFLLCGIANTYSVAIKSHGRDRSRILWSLSRDNHALVRSLVESEGLDCLYARNGSHTLALSEQEAKALSRSAKALAEDGFRGEFLDDTAVARRFPGGGFLGGLFNPDDGEMHPAHFVRGLARSAERRGARLFERTPVTKIDLGADSVWLETAGGSLSASMLLLATHA